MNVIAIPNTNNFKWIRKNSQNTEVAIDLVWIKVTNSDAGIANLSLKNQAVDTYLFNFKNWNSDQTKQDIKDIELILMSDHSPLSKEDIQIQPIHPDYDPLIHTEAVVITENEKK